LENINGQELVVPREKKISGRRSFWRELFMSYESYHSPKGNKEQRFSLYLNEKRGAIMNSIFISPQIPMWKFYPPVQ
jgi:hypothetical protein